MPHKRILRMLTRHLKRLFEDRRDANRITGCLMVPRGSNARGTRHQQEELAQIPARLVSSRNRRCHLAGLCRALLDRICLRALYIDTFYWNRNSDLDDGSLARHASSPVGQLVMPQPSKLAKTNSRGKASSREEKIAVGAIIFLTVWAAYSFSQPPTTTTTTASHDINMLTTSASHRTTTSAASSQAQASLYPLAPDFTLPELGPNGPTGKTISLSSFRGRVVLLEFMTPWCGHCQSMVPVFEKLYQQFGPQNVEFLTISGTFAGATVEDTAEFIRNSKSSWMYVYDSSGSVFNLYGVTGTPTFYIIGRDGEIASSHVGAVAFEILLNDLTRANV